MGNTFNTGRLINGLFTDANGNVGIGTTTPAEKLSVIGNIRIDNGYADGAQLVLASSGFSDWNIDNFSGNFRWYYGATERMRLTAAGNLGIGTSSPNISSYSGKVLTIGGGTTAENAVEMYGGITGYDDVIGALDFKNSYATGTDKRIAMVRGIRASSDNSGGLQFYTRNAGTLGMAAYFAPDGKIGIGTSSPSYTLDIQAGGSLSQRIRNNAAGGTATLLLETANTFSGTSQAYVQCIGTSGGGQSQLVFATAGASGDTTATERMRITSSGNVGIGIVPQWGLSGYKVLEIGNSGLIYSSAGSGNGINVTNNMYHNGSNWIYTNNGGGSIIAQNSGVITFENAPSGTAGTTASITERMRITSAGNVGIGNTAGNSTVRFGASAAADTSGYYGMVISKTTGADILTCRGDGLIYMPFVYNNTGGGSGTVAISASGELYRATSSLKYKENVTDYNKGLAEVLQLRPVYYNVKREDDNNLYAGLIAEEIEELGLTEFVQYAEDGTPDAIYYANMISLMTKAIQELSAKVTALENK